MNLNEYQRLARRTQNESLTLTHQAWSRGVFADGSLKAARFLAGRPAGLYDMKDLLREG